MNPSSQALAAAKGLLKTYEIEEYRLYSGYTIGGYAGTWQRPTAEEIARIIDRHFKATSKATDQ